MSRDFLDELAHSWGTSPKQKAREKEYNHQYYLKNKDKWKNGNADRKPGSTHGYPHLTFDPSHVKPNVEQAKKDKLKEQYQDFADQTIADMKEKYDLLYRIRNEVERQIDGENEQIKGLNYDLKKLNYNDPSDRKKYETIQRDISKRKMRVASYEDRCKKLERQMKQLKSSAGQAMTQALNAYEKVK